MSGSRGAEAVKYVLSTKAGQSAAAGLAVEGLKSVHENAGNLLAGILDVAMQDPDGDALDNPFFGQNGHGGPSPKTQEYLFQKKSLGMLGSVVVNLADVGGLTSGAGAVQNSVVWYRINALFNTMIPPSRRGKSVEYAAWYSWQVAKKAVPAGSLEIQMTRIIRQKMYSTAGGVTKTGIAFGTGGLAGIFVNAAASQLQEKLDALFGQDVQTLAQGLHWYAFRESVVGSAFGGGKGPAMRILEVLWEQVAFGRAANVSLAEVTKEPQGWLVVADLVS
ncbi:hypothetical protein [Roseococcus suduntuyensis]|uniref:Uncharacterized protein n=1 Tax=Roseococcus suduntuyensis TaxID=455361 RepID=A0A840AHZ2_9PROT|nr:hypothetical protein [Roseococcus suduntuyensis]MBB3899695.1 hypothetical protein [Roseococcus suduntuyensis]